jgi:hypothetical protein
MKTRIVALASVTCIVMLEPTLVSAAPVLLNAGFRDGHYYEVYSQDGISWPAANSAAQAKTFEYQPGKFVQGHLATLTSQAEDAFVESLRTGGSAVPTPGEIWVGGFQTACSPGPGCGWTWVNAEGAIAGVNGGLTYANWQAGEPNDAGGIDEKYLGIGHDGPGWNDEGYLVNIGGYVVEYDAPLSAADCADANGCETTTGQILQLPAQPPAGATLGVQTFNFTDNPSRCGQAPLSLFGGALVIPSYLCGSPNFLVVKTEPSFGIPSGVVRIENETSEIFPGNTANLCASPVTGNPENQAVVVWQATLSSEMHERNNPTTSDYLPGIGYAGEFTNGCGSSRGSLRGGSYHVIGMHIDFGSDEEAYVLGGYVALTTYKLKLLQVAVDKAKTANVITRAQHTLLRTTVDVAAKLFSRDQYAATFVALKVLELELTKIPITPTPFNHEGDLKMRTSNLIFTVGAKVYPLSQ